jgi:osmoprotectant transport system permease protein
MRSVRDPLLWLLLLLVFLLFGMTLLTPLFALAFPGTAPPIYPDDSSFALFLSHAEYVVVSSLAATVVGAGLGIVATRRWGAEFRPLLEALAAIGQSFPPAAVLALAVPAFGYGPAPTMIALTLYGILPVLKNTLAGLAGVPDAVREAGEGMGLTGFELLRDVELPLAAPTILAGIRLSVIINIGTAAIGSTVGAVTLGNPIIGGLVTGKVAYVLQGAIIVGLFAIVTDLLFERLNQRLRQFALRE